MAVIFNLDKIKRWLVLNCISYLFCMQYFNKYDEKDKVLKE